MEWKKIVGIVRCSELEKVEERLRDLGIQGISVTQIKGYGECADLCKRDWTVTHARVEIFEGASKAERIARAIIDAAHTGLPGDGLVIVIPVEHVYRIRTRSEFRLQDGDAEKAR